MGNDLLAPYISELARTLVDQPRRTVTGTLAFCDVSGFTRLSERLARLGTLGAETLTAIVNDIYVGLIDAAFAHGGDVVQFSGDALAVMFEGAEHQKRAAVALAMMQSFVRAAGGIETEAGRVRLRMSVGAHSGSFEAIRLGVEESHVLLFGPDATVTFELEKRAGPGQVLVSSAVVDALPPAWCAGNGDSVLLRLANIGGGLEAPLAVGHRSRESANDAWRFVPAPLRALLADDAPAPEHRLLTLAFVGIGQLARQTEAFGHHELLARIDALAASLEAACARFGVLWMGVDAMPDSFDCFLVGGAPTAHEDDDDRMVLALRDVLDADPGLGARAGVSRGRVFVGPVGHPRRRVYSVTGDATNLAARIMARASPGELLAHDDVWHRLRRGYESRSIEPFAAKGKRALVRAVAVGPARAEARATTRDDGAFVGRDAELSVLHDALSDARNGRGAAIDIVGDAGVGKSRLLARFGASAADVRWVATRGDPYLMSSPYSAAKVLVRTLAGIDPLADASRAGVTLTRLCRDRADLAPWVPLLARCAHAIVETTDEVDALDPAHVRTRLHQAVIELAQSQLDGATVFLVDDGQWLDESSSALVAALADMTETHQWLVIVSRRPSTAVLVGARTLELAPLSVRETRALGEESVSDLAMTDSMLERVVARSGGNPLFLAELIASATRASATLPERAEQIVRARLDLLPHGQRARLREASVLGSRINLDVLAAITGDQSAMWTSRWEPLSEFVAPSTPGSIEFRHDLVREAAYEGLAHSRRRALHRRAAEVLEAAGGAEPTVLALHYGRARRWEPAWRWARAAADAALAASAPSEATELFQQALACVPHLDLAAGDIAEVAERLADAAFRSGRYDVAHAALRQSRAALPGNSCVHARRLRKHGDLAESADRYRNALRWYGRALKVLATAEPSAERDLETVRCELAYGETLVFEGRFREAIRWGERGLAGAESLDATPERAKACLLIHTASMYLSPPIVTPHGETATRLFRELGDDVGLGNACLNVATGDHATSRWPEALDAWAEAGRAFERCGDLVGAAMAHNNRAELLCDQGRDDEARAELMAAGRVFRACAYRWGSALVVSGLARLELRAERLERAATLLDEARAVFVDTGSRSLVVDTDVRRVEWLLASGRPREALELVSECRAAMAHGDPIAVLPTTLLRLEGDGRAALDDRGGALEAWSAAATRALAEGIGLERLRALQRLQRYGEPSDVVEDEIADLAHLLDLAELPPVP